MKAARLRKRLETARRQFERAVFRFERGPSGAFVATDRFKHPADQVIAAGVWGAWSIKDLLCVLAEQEAHCEAWCAAGARGELEGPQWQDSESVPAAWRRSCRPQGVDSVVARWRGSFGPLLHALDKVPENRVQRAAEGLDAQLIEGYERSKKRIRRWMRRRPGGQLKKETLLERIHTERRRLEKNLRRLDDSRLTEPGVVNEWSVKDILTHLIDWEQRLLKWIGAGRSGEPVEIPAAGYGWADLDALNDAIFQANRDRPLLEVLAAFVESRQQALELIESLSESEIFEPGYYAWLGKSNLLSYILANTANHDRWAKERIRAWLKSRGTD